MKLHVVSIKEITKSKKLTVGKSEEDTMTDQNFDNPADLFRKGVAQDIRNNPVVDYYLALEKGSQWKEKTSPRGLEIVGEDWDGITLTNEQIEQLAYEIYTDPSLQYPLLSYSAYREKKTTSSQYDASKHGVPYEIHRIDVDASVSAIDKDYQLWIYRCSNCQDSTCDFLQCVDNA